MQVKITGSMYFANAIYGEIIQKEGVGKNDYMQQNLT
jgi:hypothetical protein